MSLDWSLVDNTQVVSTHNITHNLAPMAREAGLYIVLWRPNSFGYVKANDAIETLENGLALLKSSPTRVRKFNSPNGWGLYQHFVPFVEQVLEACREHPEAKIETCV